MKIIQSIKMACTAALLVCIVLSSGQAFADDALSLYVENDSRGFKPNGDTDRHYTHGTKLVYLTHPRWQWLDEFADWDAASGDQPADTVVGFFLGQNIYTPDHVDDPLRRRPEDRVFAGWLYTGLFAQRATDNLLEHIELNIGVIGPSSHADQSQGCIHNVLNSKPPKGWENQIGDEPAADFTWLRQQRLMDGCFAPTQNTDFLAEYGFTAGSVHRHAQAGLTFRYGFNLGNTFGPGRLDFPDGISTLRRTDEKSGYLFARAVVRAVEYNRFLTGLSAEPVLGEFQVGAVYQYKKLQLGYSQTFFTQEYKQQTANDSFGAITVSWTF
jgi:lipid A 3-O-deacylase